MCTLVVCLSGLSTSMHLFLSDTDVSLLLDYPSVAQAIGDAYGDLVSGQAAILPRQRCSAGNAKFAMMGALWTARGVAATKSYTSVAGQFGFLVNLFDTQRNEAVAVMQAQELTRFRTAAQTAWIAQRLCPSGVNKVALIGAGVQGRAQVQALSHMLPFERLSAADPALEGGVEPTAQSWGLACDAKIEVVSAQAAIHHADLVITATRSQQAVFDGRGLAENALVIAVGISADTGRELDDACFERASRVIVEYTPQSMREAGDVLSWLRSKHASQPVPAKLVDIPSLVSQNWPVASGIQVFKSVGTGLADTACAWLAWHRAQEA
jgi:ornithine cyclodeaminase